MNRFISLALFCWLAGLAKAQCYSRAGVERDSTYMPCNASAAVSMCCHLGNPDNGGDVCGSGSTYGLCGITGYQLWRESCTDQTWQSPVCLQLCVGATDTPVTACADGSYCCGKNATDCCNANEGKFIVNNRVSDTPAVDSSKSQTSQTTSTLSDPISISASRLDLTSKSAATLSITVQTNTVQPLISIQTVYQPLPTSMSTNSSTNAPESLSTGAKAGIATAAGVGFILSLALAASFWKRKQTQSKLLQELPATEIKPASSDLNRRPKYVYRAEVDGTMPKPVEAHGYERRSGPAEMF